MSATPIHKGEVILKERFGSSPRERLYVKPPEQSGVVIIHTSGAKDFTSWLTRVFLPEGYPDSVSKDYLTYQIWDTAQAFCSTISGILATQEVLRGVGVGDQNATPLAATITWVLKDGCGHIGRILFAYTHGKYLDAYSKKWRMYADILNNAAMCIEIALPHFKLYSLFALCISTMMKAIVGVAGGATRVAMTQHHAIMGNLADVSAKDSAQETAVNLVASVASLFILTIFGNSLTIFMLMMVLHVTFNYFAVRAVCLRTLNEPRFLLVIDKYLRQEMIATPCEINRIEPIIFYQLGLCILDMKICGFKINMATSINKIFGTKINASHLIELNEIYTSKKYMLIPKIEKTKMYVLLKEDALPDDIFCAYFHAVLLSIITCAINDKALPIYKNEDPRPFAQVCATLQSVEWSRDETRMPQGKFAYEPSYDLMKYLNKVVAVEWPRVRDGLNQTGWDLSKHLLIVDQWRLRKINVEVNQISADNEEIPTPDISIDKSETIHPVVPFDDVIKDLLTSKNDEMLDKEKGNLIYDNSASSIASVSSSRRSKQIVNKRTPSTLKGTSNQASSTSEADKSKE